MITGEVLAIIPARSGSKILADKNIRLCNGKPLLAYSIEHALASKSVTRVIVSTDSEEYAQIARNFGAETPFIRPAQFAADDSLDISVFEHALRYLQDTEGKIPGICVHLRPTHPVRNPNDIDLAVEMLRENQSLDSVRSVSIAKQTPYKMWLIGEDNTLVPVAKCESPEAYNAPRQSLPEVWMQNANIDVVKSSTILNKHSMTGTNIAPLKQIIDFDIDSESEFLRAELFLELEQKLSYGEKLTVCFDIDGIIAQKNGGLNYSDALPSHYGINIINKLYKSGHRIILFTARGFVSGIDWGETTRKQLQEWGVLHHELIFGKVAADIYVDDKFLTLGELQWLNNFTI